MLIINVNSDIFICGYLFFFILILLNIFLSDVDLLVLYVWIRVKNLDVRYFFYRGKEFMVKVI